MSRFVVRILDGPAAGRELDVAFALELGRDPSLGEALADDPAVSFLHARLTQSVDGVSVEDLGSRNGTFVNGHRIEEPTLARRGDQIVIGGTTLEVREAPALAYLLEVVEGPGVRRQIRLVEPLEVGRDPSAGLALVDDHLVSRAHARLEPLVDGVAVYDLGSRNGTLVNGHRIEEPTLARLGDQIVIGGTTLEVREAPALAYLLEVVEGPGVHRQIRLVEPLEVGRDPSAGLALVDDDLVSRAHARLEPLVDGVAVYDLGSRNGTFVNGQPIEELVVARPGDRIVVGSTVLELRGTSAGDVLATAVRSPRTKPMTAPPSGAAAAPRQPATQTTERTPPRPRWTFVLTSTALFMAVLDNLVVLFALPSIKQDLDASVQQLEWTVNAFTLAFAVFLITGAALGDRFGRRRVFVIGISLFTAASALCALAPSIEIFLVGRAIQGLGAAMITPLSLTILSAAFPAEKRGFILGAWSGIAGLAISLGPVAGGAIATGLSWPWIFWINVPIGAVVAPLCALRLRKSFGPYDRLDLPGVALVSTGLFGIVFGVVRGSAVGWTAPEVIVSLAAGCLLTGAFFAWELRTPAPMLPMHFFKRRALAASNGASFAMYFGLFGSIFLLSQFLQVAQGYSALEAGVRALPWTAMPIVVAPIAGALASRIGGGPLMVAGLALEACSLAWLALLLEPDVPYIDIVGAFVLGGVGMGLFFAPAAIVILGAVRLQEEGQASGANNAIRELGGVFGVAVLATIFSSYGSYASPQDFTDGVIPPTWVGAVVLGLGALIALAIPRTRPGEHAASMVATLPAAGGLTPGLTLLRPALRPVGEARPSLGARPGP